VRYLFGLLVVSNLAVGGWLYWQQSLAPKPATVALEVDESGGKHLQLLSEVPKTNLLPVTEKVSTLTQGVTETPEAPQDTGQNTAEATAPQPAGIVPPPESQPAIQTASCLRITNIGTKKASDTLSKKIAGQSLSLLDGGESFEERRAYWVYIPPLPNRASAREVMAILGRKKIKDYLLVRSGEFGNAISLGLFSQKEGAEKRLQEIKALHLPSPSPQIRTKSSTFRSYWLLVKSPSQAETASLTKLLQSEKYVSMSVRCPP
jgi:hypothetical protein